MTTAWAAVAALLPGLSRSNVARVLAGLESLVGNGFGPAPLLPFPLARPFAHAAPNACSSGAAHAAPAIRSLWQRHQAAPARPGASRSASAAHTWLIRVLLGPTQPDDAPRLPNLVDCA